MKSLSLKLSKTKIPIFRKNYNISFCIISISLTIVFYFFVTLLENNLSKDHYGNSLAKITNLIYEYEYDKFTERKILISKPYTSKDNNIFFIMESRIKYLYIDYFVEEGYGNSELKFIKFNKVNISSSKLRKI